jgi:hypothetical protein
VSGRDSPLLDDVEPCQNNRRPGVAVLRMARFAQFFDQNVLAADGFSEPAASVLLSLQS